MKNKIRAIIVDDEQLSLEKIKILATANEQLEIIGEGKNVKEASELISKLSPDLVFLDVNMPGKSGVELIAELGENAPFVIFTTAYSDYATEAFNLNAVHYLLKPFDQEKFDQAIERAKDRIFAKESGEILNRIKIITELQIPDKNYPDRLPVKMRGKIILVPVSDIQFIEADKNYAILNTAGNTFQMRITLNELTEKLNPEVFVRVHKSFIINIAYVKELESIFNQEYIIKLISNKKIPTGKAYKENVQKIIK